MYITIVRTKYNKNVKRCFKPNVNLLVLIFINRLTFIITNLDNKDKEEIKGYKKVNMSSVINTNSA